MKALNTMILSMMLAASEAIAANGPYFLEATMTPADGIVKRGESVALAYKLQKDGQPAVGEKLRITLKWEGQVVKQETVETTADTAKIEYASDKPGWLYMAFEVLDANGKQVPNPGSQIRQGPKKNLLYEIGAMFEPEGIIAKPSCPKDFEAFWATERKRLQDLPMDAKLTPLPNAPNADKVDSFAFSINCLGRLPVTGYLSIPKGAAPKSSPILADYLSMVTTDASPNVPAQAALQYHAIAIYVSWHGFETGHEPAWYATQRNLFYKNGGLDTIATNTDWVFHDMYLRVLRALDYMKSRPEWNGKDLIIRGGSLGGIQAIVAAALEPAASLVLINVPTACEFNAAEAGRLSPWVLSGRDPKIMEKKNVAQALAYHDAVNFAPMFHCPTFVCTGFVDEVCFPSSVYAFYNALPSNIKKVMTTNPATGHYGTTANTAGNAYLRDHGQMTSFPN